MLREYQALVVLAREIANIPGRRESSASMGLVSAKAPAPARLATRALLISRYLSRASHRRFRSTLIAALPSLCRCLLPRHSRWPSTLKGRLTGSICVGPGFLHSRVGRICDRRDCYCKNDTHYHQLTTHLQSPDTLTAAARPSGIVRAAEFRFT